MLYFYTFVSRVANSDEEINEVWMFVQKYIRFNYFMSEI